MADISQTGDYANAGDAGAPLIDSYTGAITKYDVMSNTQLHNSIIEKFLIWYNDSSQFISQKRLLFREIYDKYTKPEDILDNDVKVRFHLMHRDIKGFMGAYFNAGIIPIFSDDKSIDEELSYKLEKTAQFDAMAMNKDRKDWFNLFNALVYGSGVRIRTGYNRQKKIPIYQTIKTSNWLTDKTGNIADDNFQYHIFEAYASVFDLQTVNQGNPDTYFNLDKITIGYFRTDNWRIFDEQQHRLLSGMRELRDPLRIIHAYITISGRKYLATFANGGGLIIRWEEIRPTTDAERENPGEIKFPVAISQVFPLYEDPYGLGLGELYISPQNALNRLYNLAIIKEQRNAGFGNYLVDTLKIKDIDLLATRNDAGPVFIPAKSRDAGGLSGAVVPVQEERLDGNTLIMVDRIDTMAQSQANMSPQLRGENDLPSRTPLGTVEILQQNANVQFLLDQTALSYGEIDFWKNIWMRSNLEYLSEFEEKSNRITVGFGSQKIVMKLKDFKTAYDPYIRIVSPILEADRNREKIAYMMARLQQMNADPTVPTVSKKILAREIDRLNGLSREFIYLANPLSADEMRAKDMCKLINNGIRPKNLLIPGMDIFTYYVYISYCDEGEIKNDVMFALETELINQGINKDMEMTALQEGMQGAVNTNNINASSSASLTNNLSSMLSQPSRPSLANIKA